MKALVLKSPEHLELMDVPGPVAGPGQVLVKVHKCGICGSDLRYLAGENPWAKHTLGRNIPNPPNIILGHEFVGTVVDASDPSDSALVGRRVGVNTFLTCGRCHHCRSGHENFCTQTRHLGHGQGWGRMDLYPGGMAEYCPAFASQVYELPQSMTDEQAAMLDPLVASLHAVDVGRPGLLDRVAVVGAGPIGLLIVQLAKVYGAVATFITDIAEPNVAVARCLGVDHALNVADGRTRLSEVVARETGGRGVDRVFDTVGSHETMLEGLRILATRGVLVMMATKEDEIRFPALMLSGERTIKTSTNSLYSDFPRAIELVRSGLVKVEPLITHRFALSDAVAAFQVATDKGRTGAIKVLLDCQA
jgi:2-desacetyl-2-hydroxyethyl bacteriochlorophyllide A dehydrogenase